MSVADRANEGYGTVSRTLVQQRHESTAMLLCERLQQSKAGHDSDVETDRSMFLLNDGFVSKIAFVNHSCQPNCLLATARVVHRIRLHSREAPTLSQAVDLCDILTDTPSDGTSEVEDLRHAVSEMSLSRKGDDVTCEALLPVLISLESISAGDFLSFDYGWTATEASGPARCQCGSSECRGWLRRPQGVGKRQRDA